MDLLKPRAHRETEPNKGAETRSAEEAVRFELRHKSGVVALATEIDGEFLVLKGSEARKDTQNVGRAYQGLKAELILQQVLVPASDGTKFLFAKDYGFSSRSAAAAVVLDRNANGRVEWKTVVGNLTYHQWQERRA